MVMENEKIISIADENLLLRRKIAKLESDLAQTSASLDEVLDRVDGLKKENEKLSQISMFSTTCPTLYNKRFFDLESPRLIEIERRFNQGNKRCFGVIYVDLNHLKLLNSTHGHAGGNQAICTVGTKLLQTVRRSDMVVHVHGDEFVILFFSSNLREGYRTYVRVTRAVRKVEVIFNDGSIGVTSAMTALAMQHFTDQATLEEVCHKADLRLMSKKQRREQRNSSE